MKTYGVIDTVALIPKVGRLLDRVNGQPHVPATSPRGQSSSTHGVGDWEVWKFIDNSCFQVFQIQL
jgi:hypothetical protein